MKKIILISLVASSALFADMMMDMAKDVAISKVKTQAKETVIKQVAGNDPVKQELAKKVADKVAPEPSATDKVKSAIADKVMGGTDTSASGLLGKAVSGGTDTSASGLLGKAVSSATEEPSMQDKVTDMAVEKVVGSNPLKKAAAKEAVKSLGL